MYYTIYRTLNKVNGRYYIGKHKTEDPDDSYLGSGRWITRDIEKYGKENFEKEVLHIFNDPKEAKLKEKELVTEKEVKDSNCYNLKEGGDGGWDHVTPETRRHSSLRRGQVNGARNIKKWIQENPQDFIDHVTFQALRGHKEGWFSWKGKSHTEETKQKMSQSHKGKHEGSKNSQFGTMWITNGVESRKIKKDQAIPEGYRRGRRMT